jgi:hypothetical protein
MTEWHGSIRGKRFSSKLGCDLFDSQLLCGFLLMQSSASVQQKGTQDDAEACGQMSCKSQASEGGFMKIRCNQGLPSWETYGGSISV